MPMPISLSLNVHPKSQLMANEHAPGHQVFSRTIQAYLAVIARMAADPLRDRLGVVCDGNGSIIPFFNETYRLTPHAVTDSLGCRPSHAVSVILCQYLLRCPSQEPAGKELLTYRDFRDAAPYAAAFKATVEEPLARMFSGRLPDLRQACLDLGGREVEVGVACDYAVRFLALPKISITLLFNDRDEEFAAQCTMLFQRLATGYLDPESLALTGHHLSELLSGA
jgi:hypothetical protein